VKGDSKLEKYKESTDEAPAKLFKARAGSRIKKIKQSKILPFIYLD
jgi:hypothetical protein